MSAAKPEFHPADIAETDQVHTSLSRRVDHMIETSKWAIEQYGSPEMAARMIGQSLMKQTDHVAATTLLSVALVRLARAESAGGGA